MSHTTDLKDPSFQYSDAPQRSPEWLAIKRGRIGASRLGDWLAVSKAKTGAGKPLKPRLDYEKELMFERQFGVSFQVFVNDAMQEGIDYEDFARKQFVLAMPELVAIEVGCWYNDFIAVSPDRLLFPKGSNDADYENATAILEIKIVKDNTFTNILFADSKETYPLKDADGNPVLDKGGNPRGTGVPPKHYYQMQGQMWATGVSKGYYVALNFNTKRFVIIEVARDQELIDYMKESVQEQLVIKPFGLDVVHEIQGEIPTGVELGADIDRSDSNVSKRDWSN